jgi:hypothetical protein
MSRTYTAIKAFCLIAVTAFACWVLGESAYAVHYARHRAVWTWDKVNQNLKEFSQTSDEVRKAASAWEKNSKSQSENAARAFGNLSVAAKSADALIRSTDTSLNSRLLPSLSVAIDVQSAALLKNQARLGDDLSQISQATTQLQGELADAQSMTPAFRESLNGLNVTMQNVASATKHLDGSTEAAEQYVRWEVKKLETPESFFKQWVLGGWDLVSKAFPLIH